jgi:hypothetical protein
MAKLALINRNEKRKKLVAKFAKKRDALQAIIDDPKASDETRYEARLKIQALPRNANKTRIRNRCALTGVRAASTASSASAATSFASTRCAAKCRHRQGQLVRG